MSGKTRPYALSIAGFDPSGGAGVLADIKTMEAMGVYGMGVVTALTYQNDVQFEGVDWVSLEQIKRQVDVLLRRFGIEHFKIGIVKDWDTLIELLDFLHNRIEQPKIVYDPVLKASAGFSFHDTARWRLQELMSKVSCLTPNLPEAVTLFGQDGLNNLQAYAGDSAIYLKGGHGDGEVITDRLFTCDGEVTFVNKKIPLGEKHGSGCVLSSVVTAQLALGNDIQNAAKQANSYMQVFLASNETLLGYHQIGHQ